MRSLACEIRDEDGAVLADGLHQPHFGAAQPIVTLPTDDPLSGVTARQLQVVCAVTTQRAVARLSMLGQRSDVGSRRLTVTRLAAVNGAVALGRSLRVRGSRRVIARPPTHRYLFVSIVRI